MVDALGLAPLYTDIEYAAYLKTQRVSLSPFSHFFFFTFFLLHSSLLLASPLLLFSNQQNNRSFFFLYLQDN